jgi:hypothetical protein
LSRQAAQLSFIYFITAPYAAYDMRMLQLFIYDGFAGLFRASAAPLISYVAGTELLFLFL